MATTLKSVRRWQHRYLGLDVFPEPFGELEIDTFFRFSPELRARILTRRGPLPRVGAALHLGFLEMTGTVPHRFDRIPPVLLQHLGRELELPVPSIASLKTLYQRDETRYRHRVWSRSVLGLTEHVDGQVPAIVGALTEHAEGGASKAALLNAARVWFYEHRTVLPVPAVLNRLVGRARKLVEDKARKHILREVSEETLDRWIAILLELETPGQTKLEWLQKRPLPATPKGLRSEIAKIHFLLDLEVDRLELPEVRHEQQRAFARRLRHRSPSRFATLVPRTQRLLAACYLRVKLLESTDIALFMMDVITTDIWNRATHQAVKDAAESNGRLLALLHDIRLVIEDGSVDDREARERIRELLPEPIELQSLSKTKEIRELLIANPRRCRGVLKQLLRLEVQGAPGCRVLEALGVLKGLYAREARSLPEGTDVRFAPTWHELLIGGDRAKAWRAFQVALLFEAHKGLRNGSLWVPYSWAYRERDRLLIPAAKWDRDRAEVCKRLGFPGDPDGITKPLIEGLEEKLEAVAQAVDDGKLTVSANGIHLPKDPRVVDEKALEPIKRDLFSELPGAQLPELMVEIDCQTGFSEILLGRPPISREDLLTVYCGILAQGTEIGASGVAAMRPGVSRDRIADGMMLLEDGDALHRANEAVLDYLYRHPLTKIWGDGTWASADAMVLDTTRYLWKARHEPRRGRRAIATYAHVLDRGGIIHDLPLVSTQRQAGAALEGMLRQTASECLEKIAVDTHGHTDFGMALAKLLGFDECPRLKRLADRRLHVPRRMRVPEVLREATRFDVSKAQLQRGWDQLLRVAASVEGGWLTAVLALARFGSDASSDPIHITGTALGRLCRTDYLCDYYTMPSFRNEVRHALNQGELTNSLKRAIYYGIVKAKRGRRPEELVAISGGLTLLANLTMAWVTHHLEAILERRARGGEPVPTSVIAHISPVHYEAINFRGTLSFPIDENLDRLLLRTQRRKEAAGA